MDASDNAGTITTFTRHFPDCPKQADRYYWGEGCNCRKALYICQNGGKRIVSAHTRSREQADQLAQTERDLRDPV